MDMPLNQFKRALAAGETQIGLFLGMANAYAAEVVATAGFDWLLIDGEHGPNDLQSIIGQLQALGQYPVKPVVRTVDHDTARIKQLLDGGVQTLMVPMVETAAEAESLVRAMRYPPHGIRGVGTALARAARTLSCDCTTTLPVTPHGCASARQSSGRKSRWIAGSASVGQVQSFSPSRQKCWWASIKLPAPPRGRRRRLRRSRPPAPASPARPGTARVRRA